MEPHFNFHLRRHNFEALFDNHFTIISKAMAAQNDQPASLLAARVDQEEVASPSRPEELIALHAPTNVTDFLTAQESPKSSEYKDNLKRSDPFQFGSRYLQVTDNVYEFNAWDHVETDDTYKEYAEVQYAKQREAPVSDFDKSKWTIPSFNIMKFSLHPDDLPKCIVHLTVFGPMNDTKVPLSFAPI